MADRIRHFALLDSDLETVIGVFRVDRRPGAIYPERWDPETKSWRVGQTSLMSYVSQGEVGADEISPAAAAALISRGGLTAGILPVR